MIKAANFCVWVVREIPASEKSGIMIPDAAKPKVNRGEIITVGKKCTDPDIKPNRIAIFNKTSGFTLEEEGIVYTILQEHDIVGTSD